MKRRRLILSIAIPVIVIVLLMVWVKRPRPVAVVIAQVEQGEVQRTITNTRAGTLKACHRAGLSPAIGGQIAKLPVTEGDKVKKGDVLLEMWNDDLIAQVELAKSEKLASASRAKEACVIAEVSKNEAARLKKLHKKGLASDDQTDRIIGESKAKLAACEAAKSSAQVSESRLAVANANLERTRLRAPFDGTIAEITGEVGEFVTPSPMGIAIAPAVDILSSDCLYVLAPIDEVDAPEIKPGMPARVSLDAYGKTFFDGNVKRIAPYVLDREKQARTVDVEVNFYPKDKTLNMLPGYSADVEIILNSHANVLRIPTEALLEGQQVYVYDNDSKTITKKTIKTGLSNWQYTEVLSGLEKGEYIVTSIDREGVVDGASVIDESTIKKKKK